MLLINCSFVNFLPTIIFSLLYSLIEYVCVNFGLKPTFDISSHVLHAVVSVTSRETQKHDVSQWKVMGIRSCMVSK
jgi:hypothetical protein